MDLETVLTRIRGENQMHRDKQDGLISRCVSAIGKGDYGDVGIILDEITGTVRSGDESGPGAVEVGDADGTAGGEIVAGPPT